MTEEAFNKLVDELMELGHGEDTAAEYAALIGDTPRRDAQGFIMVVKDGQTVARFHLKFFGDKFSGYPR